MRLLPGAPLGSYKVEFARRACFGHRAKEAFMANQEQSKDGVPRKDADRPSPDVERQPREDAQARNEPDLVSPSGVNERDHGAAEDKPMAGGAVNLDDDDMVHPRGKVSEQGG